MKNLDATNVTVVGKSTDPKPTMASGYSEGDVFFEIDTSKAYMYNGATSTWVELLGGTLMGFIFTANAPVKTFNKTFIAKANTRKEMF